MGQFRAWRGPQTGAILWRAEAEPGESRILPDGVMDLMWFQGRFQFAGADTTAMVFPSDSSAVTWGLRLAPGTAYALLGVPARDLADQRLDLSDLSALPTPVVDSAPADPVDALERGYLALWRRADPEPSALRLAASLDRAARAGHDIGDIADRHGLSERSLRRVSDRVFGYGLKTLASIHRFQYALGLARSGSTLGQASAMAGYADQSHFNREVRRLAATTPGELVV